MSCHIPEIEVRFNLYPHIDDEVKRRGFDLIREGFCMRYGMLCSSDVVNYWISPFAYLDKIHPNFKSKIMPRGSRRSEIIIHLDLPKIPQELDPRKKHILMLAESPLAANGSHFPGNQCLFDHVLSYSKDDAISHGISRTKYFLPFLTVEPFVGFLCKEVDIKTDIQKRSSQILFIGTNKNFGFKSSFFSGTNSNGRRRIAWFTSSLPGWHDDRFFVLRYQSRELWSYRRNLIRDLSRACVHETSLLVVGSGWTSYASWYRRLSLHKPVNIVRDTQLLDSKVIASKKSLLVNSLFCICIENVMGVDGYISEKLFDALHCGCIPLLYPCNGIREFLPSDCFVDLTRFDSAADIVEYLSSLSIADLVSYRKAGAEFLASDAYSSRFSFEAFSLKLSQAIADVVK